MTEGPTANSTPTSEPGSSEGKYSTLGRLKLFGLLAGLLCLAFAKPLIAWFQLGLRSDFHSCTLLIPLVCVWVGWSLRRKLPAQCSSAPAVGVMLIALGLVSLSASRWLSPEGVKAGEINALSLQVLALVLFLNGLAFQTLGVNVLRTLMFPAVFLFFMVPLPDPAVNAIEIFFQQTSAEATAWLFSLAGPEYYRDGLVFLLPGIKIQVAQECSGIRSSYALFLTSLFAGHLLLKRPWSRVFLAGFVIPLGIVRNAFRIWVLGSLASRYDPAVLDSALHRQGGPLFFALSLIPFLAVVIWLKRRETKPAVSG